MRVYLVRHGDKEPGDWLDPRLGHHDNPLSALGLEEAHRVAERLSGLGIGAIRASRYSRTSQTARPLADRLGLPIVVDPRLDEIDVGGTDKASEADLPFLYPDFWREYIAAATDFRYPGGETGGEVALRVASFLDGALAGGVDVAAFSHDGLLRIAACRALGLPPWERRRFRAETCSVAELEWIPARRSWDLVRMNAKA